MAKVARSRLAMPKAECDAFLESHKWARAASVSPDGEPTVSPVGYVVLDDRLWFYGMAKGRRIRDLEAGSRISMCVDDGVAEGQRYKERRGVVVYGTARVVSSDDPVLDRVRRAFAAKHFGDAAREFVRRTHVWVEVTPYRRTSWDFGRIPAGTDRFAT
jgi:nitroimidazol reductase NimA-like FMN-containing flavoprotein (pyridoxamine 5'-phosphate oxidase superfamily)